MVPVEDNPAQADAAESSSQESLAVSLIILWFFSFIKMENGSDLVYIMFQNVESKEATEDPTAGKMNVDAGQESW